MSTVKFNSPKSTHKKNKVMKVIPINVTYSFVDGAHFFTSKDPIASGLCAASNNLETAYNEVTKQLNILLAKKGKKNFSVEAPRTYNEFREWLVKQLSIAEADITPVPGAVINWQLNNRMAA